MAYQLTVLLTLAVDLGSSPRTYLRGSSQLPIAPAPQHRTQSASRQDSTNLLPPVNHTLPLRSSALAPAWFHWWGSHSDDTEIKFDFTWNLSKMSTEWVSIRVH